MSRGQRRDMAGPTLLQRRLPSLCQLWPQVFCALPPPVPPPAPWVYKALCALSWLHPGVYKACFPAVPSQSGSSASSSFDTPPASMPASPASPTAASPTYTPGVCERWPQATLLPETPPCMPWGSAGLFLPLCPVNRTAPSLMHHPDLCRYSQMCPAAGGLCPLAFLTQSPHSPTGRSAG